MSLMITVLSETGTLPNGRPRLTGQSFHVSPTASFSRELAEVARFGDEYTMLDADCTTVEIAPEGLLALTIETELCMIDGESYEGNRSGVEELARAQEAARGEGVRVMIEIGL